MKKIAMIMMAVSALALASCTGNGEQAASGSNNASKAASASKTESASKAASKAEKQEKEGPVTLEMKNFKVDVPEGWKVKSEGTNSANIYLADTTGRKKCTFGYGMSIYAFSSTHPRVEDMVNTFNNVWKEKAKAKPDYNVGDFKAKDLRMESEFSTKELLAFSAAEKLQFKIEINGFDLKDEQVQKVLNSLKVISEPEKK